jgi:hypothetical protein
LPGSGSPTVRRRELGARLRELRTDKGWTIEQVADQLRFSPSKVSRLENGYRGVSPRDIEDLCDLYGIHGEPRQQLTELAAEGKRQAWWQSLNLPYSTYVGLEAAAASISDFGLGVVPGLLQTEDYARAVLDAFHPPLAPDVIEQRLAGRMGRQRLLGTDNPPRFEAIIEEGVLRRIGGTRTIMRAQLQHLLAISELAHVTIRVLPYEAGMPPVHNTKFIILSFPEATVPDVVFIEGISGLTADLYLGPGAGLEEYAEAFSAMRTMTASPEKSREIITAITGSL